MSRPLFALAFAFSLIGCPALFVTEDKDAGGTKATASAPAAPSAPKPKTLVGLSPGKYGCTLSVYDAKSGEYEFRPKGSIVLRSDGTYTYLGLAQPSDGRFTVDAPTGKVTLAGGHLTGGEITRIEGRTNQFLLVAPAIDGRWKCGLAS